MKIKFTFFTLLFLVLIGCRTTSSANPNPTANQNTSSGDGRTVIARPETTSTPAIVIEQEAGETSAAPPETQAANPPVPNTPSGSAANATSQAPVEQPTTLPTADIARPLLPTPGSTTESGQQNTPKQGAIGTPIDLGAAAITVNGAERSGAREGDLPRPGNEYLIVSLTLQNKSNRVLTFDASQFTLKSNDGTIVEYDDVTFQENLLRTVDMEPNAQTNVYVVFQIPSGSNGYTLVLGDPAAGGIATVKLN